MRLINAILVLLLVLLQSKLWFGDGGLRETWQLEAAVAVQQQENERLGERNRALAAEVVDLKSGSEALEERARNELGLLRPDESFYQVVEGQAH